MEIGDKYGDYKIVEINIGDARKFVLKCNICGHIRKVDKRRLKSQKHSLFICRQGFIQNLIGQVIGDYKVISHLGKTNKTNLHYFEVECIKCGRRQEINKKSLFDSGRSHENYCIKLFGGKYKETLRTRYENIKQRTSNPNDDGYKYYGARGVKNSFESAIDFIDYIYDKFYQSAERFGASKVEIDRINNDGNYERGNLRVVGKKVQQTNTRVTRYFLATKGECKVLSNNAMEFGRTFNVNGRSVGNCLRGNSKTASGWKFKILTEEEYKKLSQDESVTTNLAIE